jgi:hypothetical protein
MYNIIQKAHSGWAYLTILGLIVASVYFIAKAMDKKPLQAGDKKFGLIALIVTHVQVLLGLILLFISPITTAAFSDMGATMKDSTLRLYTIEHPLTMIIAAVVVTIAFSKIKKAINNNASISMVQGGLFVIGLLLVLSRIPWNAWMG